MSLAVDAAEARYRQVEASFESAVKQVKAQGVANEQLDALLSRMQTDLKHSLLRAQASEMGTPQRLEERLVILQRSFDAVLELLADDGAANGTPRDADSPPRERNAAAIDICVAHPWGSGTPNRAHPLTRYDSFPSTSPAPTAAGPREAWAPVQGGGVDGAAGAAALSAPGAGAR